MSLLRAVRDMLTDPDTGALSASVAMTTGAFVVPVVGETDANVPGAGTDALEQPFLPAVEDGLIAEGTLVTPSDDDVPAIARLDPALLGALRAASGRSRSRAAGAATPTSAGCSRTRSCSTAAKKSHGSSSRRPSARST